MSATHDSSSDAEDERSEYRHFGSNASYVSSITGVSEQMLEELTISGTQRRKLTLEELCTDVIRMAASFLDVKSLAHLATTATSFRDLVGDDRLKTESMVSQVMTMVQNDSDVLLKWEGSADNSKILYSLFTGYSMRHSMLDDGKGVKSKNDAMEQLLKLSVEKKWSGVKDFVVRGARVAALVNNRHVLKLLVGIRNPAFDSSLPSEPGSEYMVDHMWMAIIMLVCVQHGFLESLRAVLHVASDGGRAFDNRVTQGDFLAMVVTAAEKGHKDIVQYTLAMLARYLTVHDPNQADSYYCRVLFNGIEVAADHKNLSIVSLMSNLAYLRTVASGEALIKESLVNCLERTLKVAARQDDAELVKAISETRAIACLGKPTWKEIAYIGARNGGSLIVSYLLQLTLIDSSDVWAMFYDSVRRSYEAATGVWLNTDLIPYAGLEAALGESMLRGGALTEMLQAYKDAKFGKQDLSEEP